ncbi:hypothetical protein COT94_03935 [Candidatus Falkowbacteria bacterium CG10_big_fil_rev_8_21_14_0_10_37_14]|uniref:Uncharacterized protein n=1 Tax=Candidatus Falkowbacteria bacterium CG10_big_fil_rev_8_21_14_0_10_37_14 TaxID=1974561 RepID=A0A2M6WSC7_9BACT|nr:hypothetical protein [Candidatus Falkowbacteria bacterium]PIT95709.1 MAG: hypothetical protein COT94_03935 [Candidatus Falkowbacteria bacterium CG10_big_fil_rev_8_21_14_0_10_37_14]
MIKGGIGGANTKTGLHFEAEADFLTLIKKQKGYNVDGNDIFYNKEKVAMTFKKHELYRYLETKEIDYKKFISKKILPDDAIFVIISNTIFIIEIKFQTVAGSTDEKLQTCDFKIKQYRKLLAQLNVEVQYIYVLNKWFEKPEYKDVLDYIISISGCYYYFEYLPLQKLGLPVPK